MKYKITFEGSHIFQNGQCVGHLDGYRSICYVILYTAKIRAEYKRIQAACIKKAHPSVKTEAVRFKPMMHNGEFGARFKYGCCRTNAKKFIKAVLQNFTVEEYLAGKEKTTPVEFAFSTGCLKEGWNDNPRFKKLLAKAS